MPELNETTGCTSKHLVQAKEWNYTTDQNSKMSMLHKYTHKLNESCQQRIL